MRRRNPTATACLLGLLLGPLLGACGERPERIEPGSARPAPPGPAPGPAPTPKARFQGRVVLQGAEEDPPGAAVFLSARRIGQRLPALSRKYEISDPAWKREGDQRVLAFELTDLDNMGGFGAPMAAEMEVEARYDPDGFIDPAAGGGEPGVVRASVPASPGATGLEIVVRLGSAR